MNVTLDTASITSEELAREAQRGSHKAFDALIRRHKSEAYRVALRMCGRPFDAEEILQISLERLFRHIRKYDSSRPFRPWLFRIVTNQARTFLRIQKMKSLFFFNERPLDTEPATPENINKTMQNKELRLALEQAILTLPMDQREAFIFKQIEGLSFDEIAEITGSSIGSLRVRVHRARKAILTYLTDRNVTISALNE